jgi:Carboxypeptidase regulatory-like domain
MDRHERKVRSSEDAPLFRANGFSGRHRQTRSRPLKHSSTSHLIENQNLQFISGRRMAAGLPQQGACMKTTRLFVFAVVVTVLITPTLYAQNALGRILGTVTDESGAVVSGASVFVTNTATGVSRDVKTSNEGVFVAPDLEAGPYEVKVQATGFATVDRKGITLEVAKEARVDVRLKPGAETVVMTITGEAPIVDTTSDVLGTTFSNVAINELPLQGRDFQNLVVLQPGIQREPGGGFLSIRANGNRPEENNFIVDGIDDNDAYYGTTVINAEGVSGTPATILPIDAIQEFNVQSSPEADYGWKSGAIINVGIKSGTNAFHGSTYYFNRNSAIDARNWFNPAPATVSAINLHQFGASAGGPIFRDKVFIFGNYEGIRDKVGNPIQVNAPVSVSIGDPTESIVDAFAECSPNCSPISQKLATYLPFNPGTNPTDPTIIDTDFNNLNRGDNGILKVDYHYSQRHSFAATYFIGDSLQTEEDTNVLNPIFLSQAKTRAQVLGGAWSWAPGSRLTNQFHIGYNRFWQQIYVADHNLNPASVGINTGVTNPTDFGLPEIRVAGFLSHTIGGNGGWPLYTTPNATLQFTNSTSYVIGKHYLRFGGEFRNGSSDNLRDTYGPGYARFRNTKHGPSALENFAVGDPSEGYIAVGDSHRYVTQKSFGLFVQDAWKATPRLMVNAGLRYDLTFPIKERHNLLANFDPAQGMVQVGRQISQPYNTDYKNIAPRLGFDYDVFGNGATVIRAGAGIIYDIPHISIFIGQNSTEAQGLSLIPTGLALTDEQGNTLPSPGNINAVTLAFPRGDSTLATNWKNGGPIFGNLSPSCSYQPDNSVNSACPIFGVNRNIKTPFVTNWNLNLEQSLWKDAALTVAYVGTKGNRLYGILDINQNNYAVDQANYADEQSGRPLINQFPYLSYIDMLGNGDNSIYHSLQVTLKQRARKGLYFVGGYTWAHSIDDAGSNRSFSVQDSNNPGAERSNSGTDIRHRFSLATTYELPSRSGYAQMLKGWRMNSIVLAQSGEPLSFYDDSDDISGTGEFNDRWNFFGDPRAIHWSKPPAALPFYAYDGSPNSTNPACDAVASQDILSYAGCFAGPGWVMAPPEFGQFGNMRRNIVRGPAYFDWDLSLIKVFKFRERLNLEARAEFFDILNHPNFAGIDTDLYDSTINYATTTVGQAAYTTDIGASNPVVGSGGARHIQFGLKIIW